MVKVLIFAGGTGQRMNSRSRPKQFLELHGKPILVYTLEHFEYHAGVNEIVVVCLDSWLRELDGFLGRFGITKVSKIVPGGETGHDSIFKGLKAMERDTAQSDIVLIHDGVRPLITEELITENIKSVRLFGNAITVEPAKESVIQSSDGKKVDHMPERAQMYIAKAPQSFYYGDIMKLYDRARKEEKRSIDSAHLLSIYGHPMHMVLSTKNNIKITDPADYYMFRALYEATENQQIFGI